LLANGSQKQSFLGNGGETDNGTTSVTRQQFLTKQEQTAAAMKQLGKHVPSATDTHTIMVLYARVVPRSYKEDNSEATKSVLFGWL
jgi:hypothetical protein